MFFLVAVDSCILLLGLNANIEMLHAVKDLIMLTNSDAQNFVVFLCFKEVRDYKSHSWYRFTVNI